MAKVVQITFKDEKERPLFLRFQIIPDVTTATLPNVIDNHVKHDSAIEAIPD